MLLSYFQKREILHIAVNAAASRAMEGRTAEAKAVALSIVEAAIAAQERLVEKDGSASDRLIMHLRKAKAGMVDPQ